MDNLNKLRLLAGLRIDPKTMVTPPKAKLSEGYKVPQNKQGLVPKTEQSMKTRAHKAQEAFGHLQAALKSISEIPAVDYNGDMAHYTNEIEQLVSADGGDSGFSNLVRLYATDYRKWKRGENSRVKMEQEEVAIVSSAGDAASHFDKSAERGECCKFEVGQAVMHLDEPMIVAIANTEGDVVGIAPPGKDGDVKSIVLVPAEELTPDNESDESDTNDETTDEVEAGEDLEQATSDEVDGSDDITGPAEAGDVDYATTDELISDPLAESKKTKKVTEKVSYYYDTQDETSDDLDTPINVSDGSSNGDTVWKGVQMKNDKNEIATQLDHVGAASNVDNVKKVRVPTNVKAAMKDAIGEVESQIGRLGTTETDAHFFYKNLHRAFQELLQHIEGATVNDIKKAQVFMTSLMGPILHKIPAVVVNFVAKGGETPSLKDYMKPVDMKKFPITGPRNTLS